MHFLRNPTIRTALCLYPALVGAVGLVLWLTLPALPHQAPITVAQPEGWVFPYACCSDKDCREVPKSWISERPEGYVIEPTGEVVAYSDGRVKDSPDGLWYWCSIAGEDTSRTICLFVPPKSF